MINRMMGFRAFGFVQLTSERRSCRGIDILTIEVASVSDRDDLAAGLWCENVQVAESSAQGGGLVLQIYKPTSTRWWKFDYGDFVSKLDEMSRALAE